MALVDLLNQDLESPEITRLRRIEGNIDRFQRMDQISLKIDRRISEITDAQYKEALQHVLAGLDRIKVERGEIQKILSEISSPTPITE